MAKFHGMTRFTIADFNKGYWMVELDPESRKYTMMALDIGRFQWTRLPMGSIVAQDVFSKEIRWDFSWHSRSHRHSWWYGHLWEEQPGTWQTPDQLSGHLQKEHSDVKSRQDAIQTSTSLILWTPVECQGAQSRSKEDCSSEKNEFTQRCWHNEKFPRTFELSQQI